LSFVSNAGFDSWGRLWSGLLLLLVLQVNLDVAARLRRIVIIFVARHEVG
jgi:hypothetical protein